MKVEEELIRPRTIDTGRAALQNVNDMIRFADVKATAVLATAGVLTSHLWNARGLWDSSGSPWTRGLMILGGCSVVLSALLALDTLVPRRQETTPESLHYYRHVARTYGADREGFVDAWLESAADEEATERAVAAQIWAANLVANRKFVRMTWSIRLLLIGVAILALAVLS